MVAYTKDQQQIHEWLKENQITEVEAFFVDFSGMLRGKIIPCERYRLSEVNLPESAIAQIVTGEWGLQEDWVDELDGDMSLRPSMDACFVVPWAREPTAQMICDTVTRAGSLIRWSPRSVLKRVIRLFHNEGWQPIIAPELEFYLAVRDNNPDNPLRPPVGRTGRPEYSKQPFNIDALNEFEEVIEDIYRFAEAQDLWVDTLVHEEGVAQFEINLKHGPALKMADQVVMFKRCVRESAIRNNVVATFMAKPIEGQPGSSMHIHQSLFSRASGRNLFYDRKKQFSQTFYHYLGGLQKYAPEAMAIYNPNVNSYRRIGIAYPTVNDNWGMNNRTVGFRVPNSVAEESIRIENRIAGADANPYLAIAANLLSGYLGVKNRTAPRRALNSPGWEHPKGLPIFLEDAAVAMSGSKAFKQYFGNRFVNTYIACKRTEYENYLHVVTSWERRYLLDI